MWAYHKYVERNGEEPRLPGLEQFTPYQVFFLANANIWCTSETPLQFRSEVLERDPHSPNKFRVKGTLINMKEFSEIWGCTSEKAMNPTNKCVVW